jgi:hypothetical protein
MARHDSLPSSSHLWGILRAIDQLIAREKHMGLLGPSSSIDPMRMLPKLDLICGNRAPFLAVAAMVVMRIFSPTGLKIGVRESKPPNFMLNPQYVKGLKCRPILHGGWSKSGLNKVQILGV